MPDLPNGGPSFWGDQIRSGAPEFGDGATVTNGGTVAVRNSAGADSHNATAVVTEDNVLTGVNLAATVAFVDNSDSVSIADASGEIDSISAVVASGVFAGGQLPSTTKLLKSTVQVPCPAPTGTRTTGYVFTIVNGEITAAVGY